VDLVFKLFLYFVCLNKIEIHKGETVTGLRKENHINLGEWEREWIGTIQD
jgi:hypothetical protein